MSKVLAYLDLPPSYTPSPVQDPLAFLALYIRSLPSNILIETFGTSTTPSQRTKIPLIRNRRLRYTILNPKSLLPPPPPPIGRPGQEGAKEEEEWAKTADFLGGRKGHVGKLSGLLGGYEEERGAEEVRRIKREERQRKSVVPEDDFVPEEDTDSEDDDIGNMKNLKEQLIYGTLEVS